MRWRLLGYFLSLYIQFCWKSGYIKTFQLSSLTPQLLRRERWGADILLLTPGDSPAFCYSPLGTVRLPCAFPSPPIGSFFIILPSLSPPFPKECPKMPALAHCFCFHGTPLSLNAPLCSCPRVPGALYCPLVAKSRWHSRVPSLSWSPEVGDTPNSTWLRSLGAPLASPAGPLLSSHPWTLVLWSQALPCSSLSLTLGSPGLGTWFLQSGL